MADSASPFVDPDYRRLFAAQVVGLFGSGLTTVALSLLAYELAGASAAGVLATALTIKMALYVVVAPVVAAQAYRLPRRALLVALHLIRAGVVLALPVVTEIWQIYLLVALLQAASAAYTPTYQAVIPDLLPDERQYTRALSASQLATTMETLLSPMLAAAALLVMSYQYLFVGTAIGFVIAAALVLRSRVPNPDAAPEGSFLQRLSSGTRIFVATPRLRGLLGLNLTVAAAGAIVMVNTVNYTRDELGGNQADMALVLAANGLGTMVVALVVPRLLDRTPTRTVMLTGGAVLPVALVAAVVLSRFTDGTWRWALLAAIWFVIGAGTAAVVTPSGQVLRRSSNDADRPAVFAAQFSLSHVAWLITYPLTGWLTGAAGLTVTWSAMLVLALIGLAVAVASWPRQDPVEITHSHKEGEVDPAIIADATPVGDGWFEHTHAYVIDGAHPRWPDPDGRLIG